MADEPRTVSQDTPERVLESHLTAHLAPFFATFKFVGDHSAAVVAWLYVSGFFVAGVYYARMGVPFAALPTAKIFSAGVLFSVLTLFFLYVGMSVTVARKSGWRRFASIAGALSAAGYLLNSSLFGWAPSVVVFAVLVAAAGWLFAPDEDQPVAGPLTPDEDQPVAEPLTSGEDQPVAEPQKRDHPAVRLVFRLLGPILFISFFASCPYGAVAPTIGGGRLTPVAIEWRDGASGTMASEGSLYLVHESDSVLYLAEENPDRVDVHPIWRFFVTGPLVPRYFSVARDDIALVDYNPRRR